LVVRAAIHVGVSEICQARREASVRSRDAERSQTEGMCVCVCACVRVR